MSIETRSRDGRYEVIHRRDAGAAASLARPAASVLGIALLLAPSLVARPESGLTAAGLVVFELLLLAVGVRLLAAASRQGAAVTTLHVASGEIEVRRGRGLFAVTRALGAVETDRFVLSRAAGPSGPVFRVSIFPRLGAPVTVLAGEEDEGASRDAGLVLAQGMGVRLDDVRYATAGAGIPPSGVARTGEDRRTVLTWSYRERFRPLAALLALGAVAALSALMPLLAEEAPLTLLPVTIVALLLALAVAFHAVVTLSERRVTLRPDAVRLERSLGAVPLVQRVVLFSEIKAVLVLRRGPLASVRVRLEGGGPGVAFPFEDPQVAGWLKLTIDEAAHRAGERLAARPRSPGKES